MAGLDFSRYEILLPDERIERIAEKLRSEFGRGRLEDTDFVSFVQPARPAKATTPDGIEVPTWIPEMAVFAAISPNPRPYAKGQSVMSHGTVSLADWRETEQERTHFVDGRRDPAHEILRGVLREHLRVMTNLKEMNH